LASERNEVSGLLADWSNGDESARDKLIPLVYSQLRALAQRQMAVVANRSAPITAVLNWNAPARR